MAHANARLTPRGRRILIERVHGGWTISQAAAAAGISRQTSSKWWNRYRRQGPAGLVDRSSAVRLIQEEADAVLDAPWPAASPSRDGRPGGRHASRSLRVCHLHLRRYSRVLAGRRVGLQRPPKKRGAWPMLRSALDRLHMPGNAVRGRAVRGM